MDLRRRFKVAVPAPAAGRVEVHRLVGERIVVQAAERGADGVWRLTFDEGDKDDLYWLSVDGAKAVLDPSAAQVRLTTDGPRGVVRTSWPRVPRLDARRAEPVIYELHVRGFGGTFDGVRRRLPYLADLGVDVIELMPVHPFDPDDSYWGYMPLVWGAVHEPYGRRDAVEEFAGLNRTAHGHGIEVWLDVVFNHTGEGDPRLPTYSLRGLPGVAWYRTDDNGRLTNDSGCGNDVNPSEPHVRRLILEALDRFADLGVDGFRFDLASLLTRDGGGLINEITAWARARGVRLVAEAWDMGAYMVGNPMWPPDWAQWNDRFRDDVRGFVRAEPGKVTSLARRLEGSPDLFGDRGPATTINFVTAHDGLTMHDLTIVTSDHHHSWDCGDELRPQMLRNYLTLLLLATGAAMFVMGDEFARTQGGHDNPYDIDGPISWVDWQRRDEWEELHAFTRDLIELRRRCSRVPRDFMGVDGGPADWSHDSRALAWRTDDLHVAANMWWEPLPCTAPPSSEWRQVIATAPWQEGVLAPRSIVVWERKGYAPW